MKKTLFKVLSALLVVILTAAQSFAQDPQPFEIRAKIDAASGVEFVVSKVTADANGNITSFVIQETTILDFLTLPFVTQDNQGNTLNIFLPQFFWAVDVGSLGAGNPDVQIQYVDQGNPNETAGNGRAGLTKKGIVTAFRVEQSTNQQGQLVDNPVLLLSNIFNTFTGAGQTIQDQTQLVGGFLRLFVGISTGANTEPSGAEPFTALDAAGIYSGQLILTATFDVD